MKYLCEMLTDFQNKVVVVSFFFVAYFATSR